MNSFFEKAFSSIEFAGMKLPNRFALAPMTRVSADPDGSVTELMVEHYGRYAEGGFGLVITEGVYPDKEASQGYANQPGLADIPQAESWQPVIKKVHDAGAKIIVQLMHAGAQVQYNRFTETPIAPSAVKPKDKPLGLYGDQENWYEPEAMQEHEFDHVMNSFVGAVKRAQEAGFDGVELHAANGYLLNEFLSTHFNEREDQWGGSLAERAQFVVMLVKAVRAAVLDDFVVGIRLSQTTITDSDYQLPEGEEGFEWLVKALKDAGVDFIHTTDAEVNRKSLRDGERSMAEVVRDLGVAQIINGGITEDNYEELAEQYPDSLLAIGRRALANPDFVNRVKSNEPLAELDFEMLQPVANIENELKWREANS